ncbi:PHD finger containing protein Phf2 [Schizosaccharomyces cryophilus OY26]|uniref:PHD finger containing protein Phf2 n=1 Tax=Schizosaccharomyces cryophilus (strain OY26 / ATCC MYA-4695 / CBS 11777 / NBRC 106824 / NRRL Y48691) TaxID=653667 RepID=S9VYG1_SCHCR|nr:PHD finger containing protein Phf2 [Schizosaccharomyces cryophilus OY26]EPY50830.1 PHD finger containing protein Phf2 [Schizosaccharomyces cryophilus OY26]
MSGAPYYEDDGGSLNSGPYPFPFDDDRRFQNSLHQAIFHEDDPGRNDAGGSALIDQPFHDIPKTNVNAANPMETEFSQFQSTGKAQDFGSLSNNGSKDELLLTENDDGLKGKTRIPSSTSPFHPESGSPKSNESHSKRHNPLAPPGASPLPPMSIAMNFARKKAWPASLAIERDNTADAIFSREEGKEEQFNMEGVKTKSGRKVHRPNHFDPLVKLPTRKRGPGRRPTIALTMKCCICQRLQSPPTNRIVFCDGCNAPFHQLCHEPNIPDSLLDSPNGEWFCNACSQRKHQKPLIVGSTAKELSLSLEEKRSYLFSLPTSHLVDILLMCEQAHPELPTLSPNAVSFIKNKKQEKTPVVSSEVMSQPGFGDISSDAHEVSQANLQGLTSSSFNLDSVTDSVVSQDHIFQFSEKEHVPSIDEYMQTHSNADEVMLEVLEKFPAVASLDSIISYIQSNYGDKHLNNSDIIRTLNRLVRKGRVLRDATGVSYELDRAFDRQKPSIRNDVSVTGPIPIDFMLYTPNTDELDESFCTHYVFNDSAVL